jgi:hypothetical protein
LAGPVRETAAMIAGMAPARRPGSYVFCTTPDRERAALALPQAIAVFAEDEGTSLVLAVAEAARLGFETSLPMACITLTVHSALDGVGLTAAVAGALAAEGIACNMVAGYHHDHVFVPADRADDALAVLQALRSSAQT